MVEEIVMEIRERINEIERQLNELKASLKEEAKDDRPITERVKTFKDALDILGKGHPFVQQYDAIVYDEVNKDNADLIAYYKLRIITAALNEGWESQFTKGEYRYYPWFCLYTQEKWDELSGESKNSGVLFGGSAYGGAYAGFVCVDSNCAPSDAFAFLGSRLCFKTDALARYAGRQFAALYADYLLVRK